MCHLKKILKLILLWLLHGFLCHVPCELKSLNFLGGVCAAWFGGNGNLAGNSRAQSAVGEVGAKKRYPLSADLFGSVCYTYQHGKFRKDFGDLTRVDARLDICSASAFIKGATHLVSNVFRGHVEREAITLASPKLNMIFQQQV